jgi:hypothetical protein
VVVSSSSSLCHRHKSSTVALALHEQKVDIELPVHVAVFVSHRQRPE